MTERDILLKQLSSYQFLIDDLQLYLDTHPNDEKTIKKMNEYTAKMIPMREKFEKLYGPLTTGEDSKNSWIWVNAPWPWENEEVE
ncbi:MAG: spore coat protein CotJB [Ruminococcus sp.]|nr:spore coat protein CotJB [Ruminococcus sp.]